MGVFSKSNDFNFDGIANFKETFSIINDVVLKFSTFGNG